MKECTSITTPLKMEFGGGGHLMEFHFPFPPPQPPPTPPTPPTLPTLPTMVENIWKMERKNIWISEVWNYFGQIWSPRLAIHSGIFGRNASHPMSQEWQRKARFGSSWDGWILHRGHKLTNIPKYTKPSQIPSPNWTFAFFVEEKRFEMNWFH